MMRELASLGADPLLPNEDGTTPLMAAAGAGTQSPGEDPGTEAEAVEAVKLALALGNDVNVVDRNGNTAMHGAAYKQLPLVVRLLTEKRRKSLTLEPEEFVRLDGAADCGWRSPRDEFPLPRSHGGCPAGGHGCGGSADDRGTGARGQRRNADEIAPRHPRGQVRWTAHSAGRSASRSIGHTRSPARITASE